MSEPTYTLDQIREALTEARMLQLLIDVEEEAAIDQPSFARERVLDIILKAIEERGGANDE